MVSETEEQPERNSEIIISTIWFVKTSFQGYLLNAVEQDYVRPAIIQTQATARAHLKPATELWLCLVPQQFFFPYLHDFAKENVAIS